MYKSLKRLDKRIKKWLKRTYGDLGEEFYDFFKHYFKPLLWRAKRADKRVGKHRIKTYGAMAHVRPAYIFAERIENSLKVLFGISILLSAAYAYFLGYSRLSLLLNTLITTLAGRIVMLIIGLSYTMVGVWKLIHLKD